MFYHIGIISASFFNILIIKKYMSMLLPILVVKKKLEVSFYFLFSVITIGILFAFRFPPLTCVTNILMLYLITQAYEGEQTKKFLVAVVIYSMEMICDILSVCISLYLDRDQYMTITGSVVVYLSSIYGYILERFVIKNRISKFTPLFRNIWTFIPLISLVILLMFEKYLTNQIMLLILNESLLCINILIYYLYNHSLMVIDTKVEEEALFKRQLDSYSNQLDVMMQSEEQLSALRHDMKHHLNELILMANKKTDNNHKIVDYIQNMQQYIENKSEYSCSGNKETDSIINYMLNKAQKVLDEVKFKINLPQEMGIRPFDLTILLGNLLDNAIWAASNSKDKKLSVFIKFEKGMLFINVRNSYDEQLNKVENSYLSTKTEFEKHGIGLKNVKKVISTYHGNMEIYDTDNMFDVKIMLYVPLKNS